MPSLYLLIKPSSGMCNLQCSYCFYHDITQKRIQESYGFMQEDTLEEIIKKALLYAEVECTIAFQGGEPTLIGLPFFEKVIEFQKKYNKKNLLIHNAIQTNGYHLNSDWAKFFSEHHFLVGISIDGTRHTHDAFRRNLQNNGTFLDILNTINLFHEYHVEYNVLTVVNKRTAKSIHKIYSFYRKMNFNYLQFIPCLDPYEETAGKEEYSLSPEVYGQFLMDLFDLWYEDLCHNTPVSIRHFDNYLSILMGYPAESCDMNGYCSIQHVIESDGEVYPCDFFVFDQYKLGNLNTCSFEEVNERRKELHFLEESIVTNETCKACDYFFICRGGCKRHRFMANQKDEFNYFCKSYKIFFSYALDRMIRISKNLKR